MYNASHDFDILLAWKKLAPMYSAVPNLQFCRYIVRLAAPGKYADIASSHMTWSVLWNCPQSYCDWSSISQPPLIDSHLQHFPYCDRQFPYHTAGQ